MKCSLCDKETSVMALAIKRKNDVLICQDCYKLFCVGLFQSIVGRLPEPTDSKTEYYGMYLMLNNLTKTPTKDIDLNEVL